MAASPAAAQVGQFGGEEPRDRPATLALFSGAILLAGWAIALGLAIRRARARGQGTGTD